jgi:hypothetical protein
VRPARTADRSAVLVVPNVTVSMEAHHSIPSLILHDLLWKALPLPSLSIVASIHVLIFDLFVASYVCMYLSCYYCYPNSYPSLVTTCFFSFVG